MFWSPSPHCYRDNRLVIISLCVFVLFFLCLVGTVAGTRSTLQLQLAYQGVFRLPCPGRAHTFSTRTRPGVVDFRICDDVDIDGLGFRGSGSESPRLQGSWSGLGYA